MSTGRQGRPFQAGLEGDGRTVGTKMDLYRRGGHCSSSPRPSRIGKGRGEAWIPRVQEAALWETTGRRGRPFQAGLKVYCSSLEKTQAARALPGTRLGPAASALACAISGTGSGERASFHSGAPQSERRSSPERNAD